MFLECRQPQPHHYNRTCFGKSPYKSLSESFYISVDSFQPETSQPQQMKINIDYDIIDPSMQAGPELSVAG